MPSGGVHITAPRRSRWDVRRASRGSARPPNRIDDLDPREIALVVRDDNAVVGSGDSGDDRVEPAARTADGPAFGHQFRPCETGTFVEREDAAGKQRLRALQAAEPGVELIPTLAGRLLEHASAKLRQRQRGDEEVV